MLHSSRSQKSEIKAHQPGSATSENVRGGSVQASLLAPGSLTPIITWWFLVCAWLLFVRTLVILDWGQPYSWMTSSYLTISAKTISNEGSILRHRALVPQHKNFGEHSSIHNKNNFLSMSRNFNNRISSQNKVCC